MPLINPDLSETIVPEGRYDASVIGWDVRDSKNSNPMIVVEFLLGNNRRISGYFVITYEGADKFPWLLRACGFESEARAYERRGNFRDLPDFELEQLMGCQLTIEVGSDGFITRYEP